MANTVKLNGVRPEVIKLQLFPLSLRDMAETWFNSLPVGSMNTWEELMKAYMSRFFPPALTTDRRGEIILFKQGEEESLQCMGEIQEIAEKMSYAWNRFDHSDGYILSCHELCLQGYN